MMNILLTIRQYIQKCNSKFKFVTIWRYISIFSGIFYTIIKTFLAYYFLLFSLLSLAASNARTLYHNIKYKKQTLDQLLYNLVYVLKFFLFVKLNKGYLNFASLPIHIDTHTPYQFHRISIIENRYLSLDIGVFIW